MFKHYLPLSEKEISNIWQNGIIVFDTNILLHLYRYDITLRNKLLTILKEKEINSKFWIPSKVYEEFLKNRAVIMCDQWSVEEKIKSTIDKEISSLKSSIKEQFSHKYHAYISPDNINSILNDTIDKINNQIDEDKKNKYSLEFNKDMLLNEIIKITKKKIGEIIPKSELDEIYKEGEERYKKLIPPGYKDGNKNEPDKYSDLVIWKSIINKGKEGFDIIFVVDDKKEDWWKIEKGKTIGPQPQLRKEFFEATGKSIIFYESTQFYKYVDDYISKNKILTELENEKLKTALIEPFLKRKTVVSKNLYRRRPKKEYTKEEILSWFYENYKDPANGVPYESREGGYQYFNGGPYDPEEEIRDAFEMIDEETLSEVLSDIYNYGFEWVKKDEY